MGVSAAVGVGVLGYVGQQEAADKQSEAAANATAANTAAANQQLAFQKQQYEDSQKRSAPWVAAGQNAIQQLQAGLAPGGQFTKEFTPSNLNLDPSYAFRLQQGQANLDASAISRGKLFSGQYAKDVTNYGQNAASQEYQNAFNRFMANKQQNFNQLSGVAGLGSGTNQSLTGLGTTTAQLGNSTLQNANSQNQGIISSAANAGAQNAQNVWGGLSGTLTNAYGQYQKQGAPSWMGGSGTGNQPAGFGTAAMGTATYGDQFGSGGLW